jgi:hypothetical protein
VSFNPGTAYFTYLLAMFVKLAWMLMAGQDLGLHVMGLVAKLDASALIGFRI